MISVVLAFSNKLISEGICSLLAAERGIRIRTVNDPSLLHNSFRTDHPGVILVDFVVLINHLPKYLHGTKVLLIDMGYGDDHIHYAFISRCISGVVKADADARMLIKAIRSVNSGHLWIDSHHTRALISCLKETSKIIDLTEREKEVLCMIGTGMDNTVISDRLLIHRRTVRSHVESIRKKVRARRRWDLVRLSHHYFEHDRTKT